MKKDRQLPDGVEPIRNVSLYLPVLSLAEARRAVIVRCLKHFEANQVKVAAYLGISRSTLIREMNRLDVTPAERRSPDQETDDVDVGS